MSDRHDAVDRGTQDAALRLQALLDALPDAYCEIQVLFDAQQRPVDYRFLRTNRRFEAQTGLVGAVGHTIRALAPGHEQHWYEIYGEVVRTGQPVHLVQRAEALGRWFDVHAYRIGDGDQVGVLFTDVTERELGRARERDGERRLAGELAAAKALQQVSTRLIVGERLDELYPDVLAAACTLTGADAATLQVLDPATGALLLLASHGLHPESARLWRQIEPGGASVCGQALARGTRLLVADIEAWDELTDDDARLAFRLTGTRAVQSTPLVSRSGKVLGMMSTHWFAPRDTAAMDFSLFDVLARQVSDLIDRIRAGQALRASEERLREADLRKDEFLATLAHELRNPLATIRTAVDLIGRRPDAVDANGVHAMLQRQVEHMVRLIDDLMEVSRISRGVIELSRQPLDLLTVLRESLDAARPAIQRAGLQLGVELPAESLPLEGDKVRLAQVLSNLVSNAVRYTDAGGRIDVVAWREGDQARVSITDSGIGIAADKLSGLFTLFRQIDRRDVRSQGGLGIGLSLAQRLAQMHGGRIQAESAGLGHGSRFTLSLPLSARAAQAPSGDPAPAAIALPPRRVLVVDDNRDAADSTAMLLGAAGAQVQVAYDGPAALSTLEEWRPDLVLLDIGMPVMDGLEVARRIREQPDYDGVRLVALTGWGQGEDIARTRACGFDTHLVKPAGLTELMDVLRAGGRRTTAGAS